ncbi:hypothetical protein D3C77_411360 [compost metagenome]
MGQHCGVDGIGLGLDAQGIRERSGSLGVHAYDLVAGVLEKAHDITLVAACSFQQDALDAEPSKALHQFLKARWIIAHADLDALGPHQCIKGKTGNIDTQEGSHRQNLLDSTV